MTSERKQVLTNALIKLGAAPEEIENLGIETIDWEKGRDLIASSPVIRNIVKQALSTRSTDENLVHELIENGLLDEPSATMEGAYLVDHVLWYDFDEKDIREAGYLGFTHSGRLIYINRYQPFITLICKTTIADRNALEGNEWIERMNIADLT